MQGGVETDAGVGAGNDGRLSALVGTPDLDGCEKGLLLPELEHIGLIYDRVYGCGDYLICSPFFVWLYESRRGIEANISFHNLTSGANCIQHQILAYHSSGRGTRILAGARSYEL